MLRSFWGAKWKSQITYLDIVLFSWAFFLGAMSVPVDAAGYWLDPKLQVGCFARKDSERARTKHAESG